MSNKIEFVVIFSGIWGLIGVIFAAIGFGMLRNWQKKEGTCIISTSGVVKDVVYRTSSDSDSSSAWYPVFEYYANGERIEIQSHVGSSRARYTIGQQVTIYYDPEHPRRYMVEGDTLQRTLARIFSGIGIFAICVAVLVAVFIFIFA